MKNLKYLMIVFIGFLANSVQAKLGVTVKNNSNHPILAGFSHGKCAVKGVFNTLKALNLNPNQPEYIMFVSEIEKRGSFPCGIALINPEEQKLIETNIAKDSMFIRGVSLHIGDEYGDYLLPNKISNVKKKSVAVWDGSALTYKNTKGKQFIVQGIKKQEPIIPAPPSYQPPALPKDILLSSQLQDIIDKNFKLNQNVTFDLIESFGGKLDDFGDLSFDDPAKEYKQEVLEALYDYWYKRAILQRYIDIYKQAPATWFENIKKEQKSNILTKKLAIFAFKRALEKYEELLSFLQDEGKAPADAQQKLNEFKRSELYQNIEAQQ